VTMRLSHSKQAWPPLKPQEFAWRPARTARHTNTC